MFINPHIDLKDASTIKVLEIDVPRAASIDVYKADAMLSIILSSA